MQVHTKSGNIKPSLRSFISDCSLSLCVCTFTDGLLGKRRSFSPNRSSECPSDSKKSRSVSPKGKNEHVCNVSTCKHAAKNERKRVKIAGMTEVSK